MDAEDSMESTALRGLQDGAGALMERRAYARNLKLWLIEAEARLPPSLIGKRILDVIPFGSRLAASLAHLSVDDITAPDGYKQIITVIEDSRAYLKEARLEQAFDAAIFRGRRRPGQTLTGFLATKKAAFAELKKQGLDMLATDAGNHLLGHLLLKQGGFTTDQQQRIRVLTDGSIDFRKIELAIRKIFGDSLDESQAKTFWEESWTGVEKPTTATTRVSMGTTARGTTWTTARPRMSSRISSTLTLTPARSI